MIKINSDLIDNTISEIVSLKNSHLAADEFLMLILRKLESCRDDGYNISDEDFEFYLNLSFAATRALDSFDYFPGLEGFLNYVAQISKEANDIYNKDNED